MLLNSDNQRHAPPQQTVSTRLATSLSNWMVHHHTGRPTYEITSTNISFVDELGDPWTTTCYLPNGHPEVLT
ncbi:hypothetical protein TNCV_4353511 [Trichonephila clavipes]|nr:hypothetical protein TNCV_4353511 [Trichonephila clavipes]